ncbi:MAG: RsmE family RNA methyltransferase [Candidatus Omnitrophica bacterium]|nr:RsmE family RNA methyltransferase [Candidatus Omnitrophota bacterium]
MPRSLKRFFADPRFISGSYASLDAEESHHLRHVLRLSIGDGIELFDGEGNLFLASVHEIEKKDNVTAKIEKKIPLRSKDARNIRICAAVSLLQRGKTDFIVEKATELGVRKLFPFAAERTIVRISKPSEPKVLEKWRAISIQAAKQCEALLLPEITPVQNLSRFLDSPLLRGALLFVAHPYAAHKAGPAFFRALKPRLKNARDITIFIGPEGGFTDGEIENFKRHGTFIFSVGSALLKADTAFIAVTSIVKYGLGL